MERTEHAADLNIVRSLLRISEAWLPDSWQSHFFATAGPDVLMALSQVSRAANALVWMEAPMVTFHVESEPPEFISTLRALLRRGQRASQLHLQTEQTQDDHVPVLLQLLATVSSHQAEDGSRSPSGITGITFKCPVVSRPVLKAVRKHFPALQRLTIDYPQERTWDYYDRVAVGTLPTPAQLPSLTDLTLNIWPDQQHRHAAKRACRSLQPWVNHLTRLSFHSFLGCSVYRPSPPRGATLQGVFTDTIVSHSLRVLCTTEDLTPTTAQLLLLHAPALEDVTVAYVKLTEDMQPHSAQCRWRDLRVRLHWKQTVQDFAHLPMAPGTTLTVHNSGERYEPIHLSLASLEEQDTLAQRWSRLDIKNVDWLSLSAYNTPADDQPRVLSAHSPLLAVVAAAGLAIHLSAFTMSPALLCVLQQLHKIVPSLSLQDVTWPADLSLPQPLPLLHQLDVTLTDDALTAMLRYVQPGQRVVVHDVKLQSGKHAMTGWPWKDSRIWRVSDVAGLAGLPEFEEGQRVRCGELVACLQPGQVTPEQLSVIKDRLGHLQITSSAKLTPAEGLAESEQPAALSLNLQLLQSVPEPKGPRVVLDGWAFTPALVQRLTALPQWHGTIQLGDKADWLGPSDFLTDDSNYPQLVANIPTSYKQWDLPRGMGAKHARRLLQALTAHCSKQPLPTAQQPQAEQEHHTRCVAAAVDLPGLQPGEGSGPSGSNPADDEPCTSEHSGSQSGRRSGDGWLTAGLETSESGEGEPEACESEASKSERASEVLRVLLSASLDTEDELRKVADKYSARWRRLPGCGGLRVEVWCEWEEEGFDWDA